MDLMTLFTTWFWYVMAFAAGMLVAWLVTRQLIPATSGREAIDRAVDERLQERADEDAAGRRAGDREDDDHELAEVRR